MSGCVVETYNFINQDDKRLKQKVARKPNRINQY